MLNYPDILTAGDFEKIRPAKKLEMAQLKANRRLSVGPDVTFYFENTQTIWWQIQEMLRIEKGDSTQIADELAAYNPLIPVKRGKSYEISATMMIEIEDPVRRQVVLKQLFAIDRHIVFQLPNLIIPAFSIDPSDERNRESDHKTSAVHFLKWLVPANKIAEFLGDEAQLEITHPHYSYKASVSELLKNSLKIDFEAMG